MFLSISFRFNSPELSTVPVAPQLLACVRTALRLYQSKSDATQTTITINARLP